MTISVFITDDQAMVRQGFGALLNSLPDVCVVGDAENGRVAVREVARLQPDVVLMDVRMPEMNGLEAAARILGKREPSPAASGDAPGAVSTKIVMLTTFDLDDYVYEALRIGASGFMLKDAPAEELIRAVRVVAAGDSLLAPSVTKRLVAEVISRRSFTRSEPVELATLTAREREVLELVASGKSNQEIAGALFVAEQTVKTHVSKVLSKLGLRDRAQAVVYAYETGVVIPGG